MTAAAADMRIMVKLSVASSSGKLDLSDCDLTEVPDAVCNLIDLEVSHVCEGYSLHSSHHAECSGYASCQQLHAGCWLHEISV